MARPDEDPSAAAPAADGARKWATHIMGPPAGPQANQYSDNSHPYMVYNPVQKPARNPCEHVVNLFDSWSQRAEGISRNIWHNLRTGPSVSEAAWGKVNLATKAITEGGFESLFQQVFPTGPSEKLKKTFACYLSSLTGPVAGTLYLSSARVAFCSDRLLSFRAPSGQEAWSYYKVSIPLGNIENVNPVAMRPNAQEKCIHVMTVDGFHFWFMGFINFDKALRHLLDGISGFRARPVAIR